MLYLFIALAATVTSWAQVSSVSLQASGLTCSMCSNAINKALKTPANAAGIMISAGLRAGPPNQRSRCRSMNSRPAAGHAVTAALPGACP